ncbi:uridine phosphorylase [Plakobranchus ocellatus]|uniref:Uridine phosphorylase n=1 Tax=Plakobranchus ocellatus TaxID=259542 RepID=A0AAV3YVU5_9GAST|nr:uridine phosphorylase [Plakobranchus ocellatus]
MSEKSTVTTDNNSACTDGCVKLPNPHLSTLDHDALFHIQVPLHDTDTLKDFSKIKFVCIGGTPGRMKLLAQKLARELNLTKCQDNSKEDNFDYAFTTERYSGFKVGPVFCVNHGIGQPSVAVVLHEVFKLLQAAGCSNVTLIRIGTCGGIGLEPGTTVITSGVLTAGFKEVYVTSALGRPLELPVKVDPELVREISSCASDNGNLDLKVKVGKTFCAEDFYQSQGRLDGSFCDYSKEDQICFLNKLQSSGVCNIEMESAAVLALAHKVQIRAAVICVVIVNRLKCDLPSLTAEEMSQIESYPLELVTRYIKRHFSKGD